MSAHDHQAADLAPPITVAVVSWNTRELLEQALRSLKPDAEAGRAQVWVVDNNSTDGSAAMTRERHPWVALVASEQNLGFGAAINLVAARTRGPWLVASNADVSVQPGTLSRLQQTAEQHPRVGIVGPRLLMLDGSTQPSVQPFPGLRIAILSALHADRYSARAARTMRITDVWEPDPTAPDAATPVPWVTGALVLITRAAFEQAGGFDPDQWLYGEDLDLCWRIRACGWQIAYDPGALAHHAHSAASTLRFGQRALGSHITAVNLLWMLRRRGAFQTRTSALLGVIDAALRTALLTPAARRNPRRFADRAEQARWALRHQLMGLRSERRLVQHASRARGGD